MPSLFSRRIALVLKTALSAALAVAVVTSATTAQAEPAKQGAATADVLAKESGAKPVAKAPAPPPPKAKAKAKAAKTSKAKPRDTKAKHVPKPAHAPRALGKPESKPGAGHGTVPAGKGPKRRA
jgi:hypothetical protein